MGEWAEERKEHRRSLLEQGSGPAPTHEGGLQHPPHDPNRDAAEGKEALTSYWTISCPLSGRPLRGAVLTCGIAARSDFSALNSPLRLPEVVR